MKDKEKCPYCGEDINYLNHKKHLYFGCQLKNESKLNGRCKKCNKTFRKCKCNNLEKVI